MDAPRRPSASQSVVLLLVGGLVGFGAGYFAGGGGRPSRAAAAAAAPAGDRLAEITRALERDPENPEILMDLGNTYYDREDWDHAIEAYEKARRKAPKNANLLSDLGAAHRNRGEFDLAVAFFQKARQADPDHWESLLNWLLVEAYDRRDPRAAQLLYDQVKSRYPDIPQIEKIQEQITSLRKGAA